MNYELYLAIWTEIADTVVGTWAMTVTTNK